MAARAEVCVMRFCVKLRPLVSALPSATSFAQLRLLGDGLPSFGRSKRNCRRWAVKTGVGFCGRRSSTQGEVPGDEFLGTDRVAGQPFISAQRRIRQRFQPAGLALSTPTARPAARCSAFRSNPWIQPCTQATRTVWIHADPCAAENEGECLAGPALYSSETSSLNIGERRDLR